MDTARSRERGFVPLVALGIITLLVVSGALLYARNSVWSGHAFGVSQDNEETSESAQADDTKEIRKGDSATMGRPRSAPSAAALRFELEKALKSGGINPSRLNDIMREIDALAATGADVTGLRATLSKINVGGSTAQKQPPAPPVQQHAVVERIETKPYWEYDPSRKSEWQYFAREGVPPSCPEPIVLPSPVDLALVTAILYPGQVRGDGPKDFKPHGGFTLKAGTKAVELRAPMDGYLTSVAKFTDEFGLHYGLTFQNPCGIQFGGGHFGALPPDIQAVVDKVPLKGYGVSPTEPILPPYFVKKGQVIVTGLQEKANPERPGFDWGVADLRHTNAASKDPRFQSLYGYAPWNTYYGVCWLDLLPPEQETIVRSFPGGDYKEGKNSEYCK